MLLAPACLRTALRPGATTRTGLPGRRGPLTVVAASRQQQQQQQQQQQRQQEEEVPQTLPRAAAPAQVPEGDFWEGEQFDAVGKIGYYFIPILVVLAIGVGAFASNTYMEGATVFLDSPKSAEDTVRLIPAQQLQP